MNQSTLQHNTLAERTGTIVRSIASGNNACGTLISRDGRINEAFIAESVRPTLEVYEQEADELRMVRSRLSQESEERRQALAFVYSNAYSQLPADVAERVRKVLGYAAS